MRHSCFFRRTPPGFPLCQSKWKLLKRNSFTSFEDLQARVFAFLDSYNQTMASLSSEHDLGKALTVSKRKEGSIPPPFPYLWLLLRIRSLMNGAKCP